MKNNKYFWPKQMNKNQLKSIGDGNNCIKCGLYKKCISPKMSCSGEGKKKIMFIAEAPGESEDKRGIQLIGKAGQLLRNTLEKLNIDLDGDCWKDNSVICRPPHNRKPTNTEIKYCSSHIFKNIIKYKPKKIITLGLTALSSLIGDRMTINSMGKWVGFRIPDQEIGCWVFPTYHPSYIQRNENNPALKKVLSNLFSNHLEKAINWNEPFMIDNEKDNILLITDPKEVIFHLKEISEMKYSPIAFDYETTGLIPFVNKHKIICMSIAYCKNNESDVKTIVFPIFEDNIILMRLLKSILTNSNIKKIAHNFKYEDSWTRAIFNCDICGWYWDTMLAAHCIDNRPGITGLKFQIYKEFGIFGYENEVSSYLKSNDGIFGKNKLEEIKNNSFIFNKVLLYCGIDSKYTYKLWLKQKYIVKTSLYKGYKLLHNGALEFSKIENDGILIDKKYYELQSNNLQKRLTKLEKRIYNYNEIKNIWKENNRKKFNPRSNLHMQDLLYRYLKIKKNQIFDVEEAEEESIGSVNANALSQINIPFTNTILQYRKLYRIRNTYLKGFLKNSANSFIHPGFLLNTVRTFRSSSSNPNFQNIPKRNMEAQKIVRKGLIPRKGNLLLEVDYSGLEVHISTCYHKDPVMVKYLNDSTTDMHRDQACLLFKLKPNQITKEIRYEAKNKWVFAQFYGSYYKDCAPALWNIILQKKTKDNILLIDHLKKNGIKSFHSYENYLRTCQYDFWHNKFKIYGKWKEKVWNDYQEKGYFDFLTGFRCSGLMKKNEVLNYKIQGTAFHCLLWSLIQVNKRAKKEKWKSKIIGQIHDAMNMDVDPNELEYIVPIIKKTMCEDIRKKWKWINIPLNVDIEISEINGNWYEMKEYKG